MWNGAVITAACTPLRSRTDRGGHGTPVQKAAGNGVKRFLLSRLFRIGLILFIAGTGPLIAIMLAAMLGVWPDPNPIGPGLLAMVTFWPSVIFMAIGAYQVVRQSRTVAEGSVTDGGLASVDGGRDGKVKRTMAASLEAMLTSPLGRAVAATLGFWLIRVGVNAAGSGGRGPASALVLGSICLWFCVAGRIPSWFRR